MGSNPKRFIFLPVLAELALSRPAPATFPCFVFFYTKWLLFVQVSGITFH
jgi:hypothetical protein